MGELIVSQIIFWIYVLFGGGMVDQPLWMWITMPFVMWGGVWCGFFGGARSKDHADFVWDLWYRKGPPSDWK